MDIGIAEARGPVNCLVDRPCTDVHRRRKVT